jgi:hypothetical protein
MLINMVIAGTNANGDSDLFFCKVDISEQGYADGEHFTAAQEYAQDEGYEGPFVVFDQYSPPKPMFDLFEWNTASVIKG